MSNGEPFDRYAEKYDAWYESENGRILYENEKKCIAKILSECHGRVLEVGAGTGRFSLLEKNVFGVDIALAPLKIAKLRGIKVIQAKAEELPFRDNTFSCVMFIVTICFVDNPQSVLVEARRILTDEGKIIIGEVFSDSELGRFYAKKKTEGHIFYKHANFYSFRDFKVIVNSVGLKIGRVFGTLKKAHLGEPELEEPENVTDEVSSYGFLCVELTK